MILYPTETVYALGVGVFDNVEITKLFALKNRSSDKSVSWLVRSLADITEYAEISHVAEKIAERFLPGPLTLVLPAKATVPKMYIGEDQTIGFRISSDRYAQEIISDFMKEYGMPLTCTSANVSGLPTLSTTPEILNQFGSKQSLIDTVYDGGVRIGVPSTIVRVIGKHITILREGSISKTTILNS